MGKRGIKDFTFVIITYNHEDYILEHLESIKYIVQKYGKNINISIVVSDDASKDSTISLVKFWINENRNLFSSIVIIDREFNVGVCKSVSDCIDAVKTKFFKLTAGDDVYSCESLFDEFALIDEFDMVSGVPLNLIDGVVYKSKFNVFNLFATDIIYKSRDYIEKLKNISFSYAPAIVYSYDAISNYEVKKFLNKFSVTEDFPIHIRMAEVFRPLKFLQRKLVYVYYRRTAGSIYLIRKVAFNQDKLAAFDYLLKNETSKVGQLLLKNRISCYKSENRYVKLFCNLGYYLYAFKIIINLPKILLPYYKFDFALAKHQAHYNLIKTNALHVKSNFDVSHTTIVNGVRK